MIDPNIYVRPLENDFLIIQGEAIALAEAPQWQDSEARIADIGYRDRVLSMRDSASRILHDMAGRMQELPGLLETAENPEALERAQSEILDLASLSAELGTVFRGMRDLDELASMRLGAAKAGASRFQRWMKSLGTWIKRFSNQLWQLLSSLFKPKEWKLAGSIGTGPFNLVNASIEVTFDLGRSSAAP
ncbi:hypothetical protein V6C03_06380 [Methyloligella sp. 2.7D]|uniref:hypothetical protein n=1 Tax=unclassified Methyloligella TaxID=2625955 RepID=UPI00157CD03C|nr:hypothetical protein [Methyloligella sp. GL2]QKP78469.1 hypothetical protein HT051_14070 [Methyloligella sp. GL2]